MARISVSRPAGGRSVLVELLLDGFDDQPCHLSIEPNPSGDNGSNLRVSFSVDPGNLVGSQNQVDNAAEDAAVDDAVHNAGLHTIRIDQGLNYHGLGNCLTHLGSLNLGVSGYRRADGKTVCTDQATGHTWILEDEQVPA